MTNSRRLAVVAVALTVGLSAPAFAQTQQFAVDCAAGQSISSALERGDVRKPLLLTIIGSCRENVSVSRDDVTLQGDKKVGGAVRAPDANTAAITILGNRVTIERVSVSGGSEGILVHGAFNAVISNSTVQNTKRNAIFVLVGHARILNNTIGYAGIHGVSLQGGNVLLSNNLIQYNTVAGVHLEQTSNVNAVNNTISGNGSNGVEMRWNSHGQLIGNTISGNGFNPPTGPGTTTGVHAERSTATIQGGQIAGNKGNGVGIFASVVEVSNVQVLNNGGGVGGAMGSIIDVIGGTISGNGGFGVSAQMSIARVRDATVSNNAQPMAISISQGSKLTLQGTVVATGNGGYGLDCADGESSYVGTITGTISPACTGF